MIISLLQMQISAIAVRLGQYFASLASPEKEGKVGGTSNGYKG